MFNDVGLLAEIDKPTKAPWFLRLPEQSCGRTASLEPPAEQAKTAFGREPPKASFLSSKIFFPISRKRRVSAPFKKPPDSA